ncbi:hypothetical protein FOZ62_012241 [Perkinsus olseni]|uniref:Uncharacterized protein n=1 Tax=Perkinsus olseni TaxID=32597 RepID=A0A7J6TYS6_PEROL|nr:hypothetical protein FOZ62_012241 [Perkinsus olseni]
MGTSRPVAVLRGVVVVVAHRMSNNEQCCQEWMTKLEERTIELASASSREALLKRELESLTAACARAEAKATGLEEEKKDWQMEKKQLEAEWDASRPILHLSLSMSGYSSEWIDYTMRNVR